ncbi:MAG: heme-binding protein [Thermoplasmata archaeon]|nr:heme-binding protein [Thermoplasmata archaeon]
MAGVRGNTQANVVAWQRGEGEQEGTMVEKIHYEVVKKMDTVEMRRYPKILLATVKGLPDNEAFGILFDYIAGKNRSSRSIPMTAPVISSEYGSEKIPMTVPVVSGRNSFSFVMPSSYSVYTIPEPVDSRMVIEEVPERRVAVITFRGRTGPRTVQKRTDALLEALRKHNIQPRDEPFLMRYNPPFTPGVLRRNEIGVEVEA